MQLVESEQRAPIGLKNSTSVQSFASCTRSLGPEKPSTDGLAVRAVIGYRCAAPPHTSCLGFVVL